MRSLIELLRSQHYVQTVAAVRLMITFLVLASVLFLALDVRQPRQSPYGASLTILFGVALLLNVYIFWLSSRRRIDRWLVPLAIVDVLFISEAAFATGGIASPLELLMLFPIGVTAVTVSMRAAIGISVLTMLVYTVLAIDPVAAMSTALADQPSIEVAVLQRFTLFNVGVSDVAFLSFALTAGWLGDALRRQENRLLERSSRLRGEVLLLSRLAKTASRHTDLAPVLATVLQTVGVELAAERAAIYLEDPNGGPPLVAASQGLESVLAQEEVLRPEGVVRRAVRERRIVQSESRALGRGRHGPPAVAAPLLVGTDCLGCLYLDAGHGHHRWSRDALELLAAIADLTAVAIQNAQLYSAATYEQSKLEATIAAVSDAMLLFDTDGRVLLANRRFIDLFGLPGQVRGLALSTLPALCRERLLPGAFDDEEELRWLWAQLLEPSDSDFDLLVPTRTFQRRVGPVLDEQGQQVASILTLHDITDERQAAMAKDEILASVSHELRTPLTTVKGYTQIFLRRLQRGDNHFTASEFDVMLEQIDRLTQLVDELLDVSRLPAARVQNRGRELVDLRKIVTEVTDRIATTIPDRRIVVAQPEEPVWGPWTSKRIAQALENLINNALKFSPEQTTTYVRLLQSAGTVTISVRDEGIGVADEHAEQIFQPFYRVDNSTTRRTGGLGLGLYVTKLIAEQQGGSLTVESAPGAGSTFLFSLPNEP